MLVPGMLRREAAPPETVATRALTDMAEVAGGQPLTVTIALSLCPVPAVLDMWSSVLLCSRPEPRLLAFNVGHVLSALNRAAAR